VTHLRAADGCGALRARTPALTAIPLGLAFFFRSLRGERLAGLAVVLAIFISALVALGQTVERLIHARAPTHLVITLVIVRITWES